MHQTLFIFDNYPVRKINLSSTAVFYISFHFRQETAIGGLSYKVKNSRIA